MLRLTRKHAGKVCGMTIVHLKIDDQVGFNLLVYYHGKGFLAKMFSPLMIFSRPYRPMSASYLLSQWGLYCVLVVSSRSYTFSPEIFTYELRLV